MTTVEFNDLLRAPDWFLLRGEPLKGLAGYVRASPEQIRTAPFHDERFGAWLAQRVLEIPLEPLTPHLGRLESHAPAPALLFHTAFCCSTLLARILEPAGSPWVLREPLVMRDLVSTYQPGEEWEQNARLLYALLAWPPSGFDRVVIKPSNLVNPLAFRFVQWRPDSRALVLTCTAQEFLVSVLKKARETRDKMAGLARYFLESASLGEAFDPNAAMLEQAALVWAAQRAKLLRTMPSVKWLDAGRLLERDRDTIAGILAALGLPDGDSAITAVIDHPGWTRHAKAPDLDYGLEAKQTEDRSILDKHRDAIAAAIEAARSRLDSHQIDPRPDQWLVSPAE